MNAPEHSREHGHSAAHSHHHCAPPANSTIAMPTPSPGTIYTCPMHPEIVRDQPGNCPICGMALESRTVALEEEENPELKDMTRRFWIGLLLTVPLIVVAMGRHVPGMRFDGLASSRELNWLELLLATPVVLWGGWLFFERGWQSLVNRSLNMFTLIALGVGVAYVYSAVAVLLPALFPPRFATLTAKWPFTSRPPPRS